MLYGNNLDIFACYLHGLFFSAILDINTSDLIYLEMVAGSPYTSYLKFFCHFGIWQRAKITDTKVLILAWPESM